MALGDAINISSDKGVRHHDSNMYEAIGSVVINHHDETLYGERAVLFLDSKRLEVIGNVRYVNPQMTMYGSELDYNFRTGYLGIKNGRVHSQEYNIIGEYLARKDSRTIIAKNAEYTTCIDCPESWSVYGKKIRVDIGNYVTIKHALIKIKGVTVLYFPYIIFPIKKGRQTGFLLPRFSVTSKDGGRFFIPYFWAIKEDKDMTITPGTMGKRGYQAILQYRQILGEDKWFEVNSLNSIDSLYYEEMFNLQNFDRDSGTKFRHFLDYEHHYTKDNFINHHLKIYQLADTEMTVDYPDFYNNRNFGSEVANEGYFNFRTPIFDFNFESYFARNLIFDDIREFDQFYVQPLGKFSFESVPYPLFKSDWALLRSFWVGIKGHHTYFKQNHFKNGNKDRFIIRNANRSLISPFIDWNFGKLGPFLLQTKVEWQNLIYSFPGPSGPSFTKSSIMISSKATLEMGKVFGPAYIEKVPLDKVESENSLKDPVELEKKKPCANCHEDQGLIGSIPSIFEDYSKDFVYISHDSYKHSVVFDFIHHQTPFYKENGNTAFGNQINEWYGVFDYLDIGKVLKRRVINGDLAKDIPKENSFEIKVFNYLVKKSAKTYALGKNETFLKDNFYYNKVAFFNISQGFLLSSQRRDYDSKLIYKNYLTRLHLQTGFTFKEWDISMEDYYFYTTKSQIFNAGLSKQFSLFDIGLSGAYNSFESPASKKYGITFNFKPFSDKLNFGIHYSYDIERRGIDRNTYSFNYNPNNNCWKGLFEFSRFYAPESKKANKMEKSFIISVMINPGGGKFYSLGNKNE